MPPAGARKDIPFKEPGNRRTSFGDALRTSLPVISLIVSVFITLLPWGVPGLGLVTPILPLILIFFWTLDFPAHMPAVVVCLAGLAFDFLSGNPAGLWALGFLILYVFAITQRQALAGKPFIVAWAGFLLAAASSFLAVWLVAMAIRGTLLPIIPTLISLALTVILYPVLVRLLGRIRKITGLEYEA